MVLNYVCNREDGSLIVVSLNFMIMFVQIRDLQMKIVYEALD
jgi:hypothetical protein